MSKTCAYILYQIEVIYMVNEQLSTTLYNRDIILVQYTQQMCSYLTSLVPTRFKAVEKRPESTSSDVMIYKPHPAQRDNSHTDTQ